MLGVFFCATVHVCEGGWGGFVYTAVCFMLWYNFFSKIFNHLLHFGEKKQTNSDLYGGE